MLIPMSNYSNRRPDEEGIKTEGEARLARVVAFQPQT